MMSDASGICKLLHTLVNVDVVIVNLLLSHDIFMIIILERWAVYLTTPVME